MNKKRVYHLSHTDLDGYGCQYVTKHYFENITFFNSNYGREIDENIDNIVEIIRNSDDKECMILITDLNLTVEQAENLVKKVDTLECDVELKLLDHHKTGVSCSKLFSWYFLDESRCATKITYDHFSFIYGAIKEIEELVAITNAVDLWLTYDKKFELGKVCMKMISSSNEISRVMFPNENSEYMLYLISKCQDYFAKTNPHIKLEDALHRIKKSFFKESKDDTLDNLVSDYVVDLLSQNKERFEVVYKGQKGILTYSIGNISVIGNNFLVKNPDYDFFINVTPKKSVGLRANGRIDVSQISKDVFGGGGHANASGGMFNNFKDSYIYENIKNQFVELFRKSDKQEA
jgi:oligoribonuclease NrnB/cAMP/cGMP phosphodiesterase (DHH superfamily)